MYTKYIINIHFKIESSTLRVCGILVRVFSLWCGQGVLLEIVVLHGLFWGDSFGGVHGEQFLQLYKQPHI